VRIVGIGGSAGGQSAVVEIVERLSPWLDAVVLVTVHLRSDTPSNMARILDRASLLTARNAKDGEVMTAGTILVAPPDRHLLVEGDRVRLSDDAKVNGVRPAIDAMLSSLTSAGRDAAGVILSGVQDDGARGLREIAEAGGRTLVQDPDTALYPDMPRAALAAVEAHVVGSPRDLARNLMQWIRDAPSQLRPIPSHVEASTSAEDTSTGSTDEDIGMHEEQATLLTCPLCHGVLTEHHEHGQPVFGCQIGHVFNPGALLAANADALEETLLTALRTMFERARLLRRLSEESERHGRSRQNEHYAAQAQALHEQAEALAGLLGRVDVPIGNGEQAPA
jgi:two-component system, chemotaxis family, protein-glutamate methylesterase/glutaminase